MTMKMVVGTARFASGRLNMVDKSNIDIQTPTASIAVRGTDFTTTIDELGRTLVILLPDDNGDPSGTIVVSNEGGSITLEEAYAATMVATLDSPPTAKVVIQNITPNMIDNMFIVSPPEEVKEAIEEAVEDDLDADQGILDVDFLEFNELEKDALEDTKGNLEYSELDIDLLDVDFLTDLLDVVEELVRTTAKFEDAQQVAQGQFRLTGADVGFNKESQYNIFEQDGDVVFFRSVNGIIRIQLAIDSETRLETFVEGYEGIIDLNGGADSIIVIRQGG
tara:strand:- start:20 stop:853 length:834 start_codon:yes stop_codon:yes gene_type:complete